MGWLLDLMKDIPITPILKERLALAEDKIRALEEENRKLRDEKKKLLNINKALQGKVKEQNAESSFIEDSGVLFKIKDDGNFEKYAYCPICKQAMSMFPPGSNEMLICARCTYTAPFRPNKLSSIREKVMHNYYNKMKGK